VAPWNLRLLNDVQDIDSEKITIRPSSRQNIAIHSLRNIPILYKTAYCLSTDPIVDVFPSIAINYSWDSRILGVLSSSSPSARKKSVQPQSCHQDTQD
jgi:hypothetical protein